jgi:hypothetical protein
VNEEWTVTQPCDGKATFDLGDKYELVLDENKSQIIIRNKETGEQATQEDFDVTKPGAEKPMSSAKNLAAHLDLF